VIGKDLRMTSPNFSFENKIWSKGFKNIAGVDEVGRGSFAGPVVAAAVVFNPNILHTIYDIQNDVRIDDSKKLTSLQREKAEKWIKKNATAWGIGEVSTSLINRMGIGKATRAAFRRAIANTNLRLEVRIDYLLIDAFYIPRIRGLRKDRQLAIIKGDQKSISIAAASIIAKVYRDKLMLRLSKNSKYINFGWERNKGYGTGEHQRAIMKYGITRYHRSDFIETYLSKMVR